MLDKRAPRVSIAECYSTQFDLELAALWHPIDGYNGNISGIMQAMPQIPDGLQDMVWRKLLYVQECLRIKVQYRE